jgi:hypothetical protein
MSFRTQGRVDVEPASVADSLCECATGSPRAWEAAVTDIEDEVVEIFFSGLSAQSSQTASDLFDFLSNILLLMCICIADALASLGT